MSLASIFKIIQIISKINSLIGTALAMHRRIEKRRRDKELAEVSENLQKAKTEEEVLSAAEKYLDSRN